MENKRHRMDYIDMTRGFAICLVVLGHIWDNPLCNFITSFHVPVFFVLSGYLTKLKDKRNQATTSSHDRRLHMELWKRTKQLMVPYVVYSVVWISFTYFALDSSLELLRENVVQTVVLYGCGALWFLPAILIAQIIFLVLRHICVKNNMMKALPICVTIMFGIGVAFLYTLNIECKSLITILRSLVGLGFFAFGYWGLHYLVNGIEHKFVLGFITLLDLILAYCNGTVDLWGGRFNNLLIYLITSLLGSYLCVEYMFLIKQSKLNIKKIEQLLIYFGCNTLPIIGTHQLLIKLIQKAVAYPFSRYVPGIVLCAVILFAEIIIIFIVNRLKKCISSKNKETFR